MAIFAGVDLPLPLPHQFLDSFGQATKMPEQFVLVFAGLVQSVHAAIDQKAVAQSAGQDKEAHHRQGEDPPRNSEAIAREAGRPGW